MNIVRIIGTKCQNQDFSHNMVGIGNFQAKLGESQQNWDGWTV